MLPPFLDAMRNNAEGTPADIQEPTDDSAFEKRSRELVTLYRYTLLTHPVTDHILTPSHSHTLTPSSLIPSHPHTLTLSHLHRVSDASGTLEVTPVGKYPLKREMLDTKVGVALQIVRSPQSAVAWRRRL